MSRMGFCDFSFVLTDLREITLTHSTLSVDSISGFFFFQTIRLVGMGYVFEDCYKTENTS